MISFPFGLPSRYEFTGERLQGGQGYVYICNDHFLARKVAIKVMASIADAAQLKHEFAAMRDIRSQHIAEIYDLIFAKRSGMAGLIQEFVPGVSLEQYSMDPPEQLTHQKTLWQLSRGLVDIHSHGKLHRDIKPSNARFDSEGVLKILDFGIASEIRPDAVTVNARGTRCFLAPEFYGPPPIKLTQACDVYAFGVTTWYIATKGQLPYVLQEAPPQRTESVPSLASVWPDWPQSVVTVLDRALAVKPSERPSVAEITTVLKRHLLFGKHRITFWYNGRTHELKTPGRTVKLETGADSIIVEYDGLTFSIKSVVGDVYLNNMRVVPGMTLPGSCVFTLGGPSLGFLRKFVTADISHPEVMV